MGRRISKKVYTGTSGTGWTLSTHQKFVYNDYKQIAEFDSSDNLQKTYTWQPIGLDVPLWVNDSSNYYYYIVDGNKNVREMVDTSGNLVASYDYNPFGKITSSGTYASTNKFRFSSEYHDDETELVYYNYRYYDPELGRWLNRDPIGEKGGYNLYGMVQNNAVDKWDKLGFGWTKTSVKAITGNIKKYEYRAYFEVHLEFHSEDKCCEEYKMVVKGQVFDQKENEWERHEFEEGDWRNKDNSPGEWFIDNHGNKSPYYQDAVNWFDGITQTGLRKLDNGKLIDKPAVIWDTPGYPSNWTKEYAKVRQKFRFLVNVKCTKSKNPYQQELLGTLLWIGTIIDGKATVTLAPKFLNYDK